VASIDRLIKKIDNCRSTEWKSGSGRQGDAPCSHKNPHKIQEQIEHCSIA